jgi:hypothetical protein
VTLRSARAWVSSTARSESVRPLAA